MIENEVAEQIRKFAFELDYAARSYSEIERFRLVERQPGALVVFVVPHGYDDPYRIWGKDNLSGMWAYSHHLSAAVFLNSTDEVLFRTHFGAEVIQ